MHIQQSETLAWYLCHRERLAGFLATAVAAGTALFAMLIDSLWLTLQQCCPCLRRGTPVVTGLPAEPRDFLVLIRRPDRRNTEHWQLNTSPAHRNNAFEPK